MSPLVTIVIPTYNYAHYIHRAIDSAIKQSYPNIEIVIVDDGSTDNTRASLAEYGDKIRYVWQENQGASAARNRGLAEARGEFIAFLDADDAYLPNNIAEKINFLSAHDEYAWCYSNWAWVHDNEQPYMFGHEPVLSLAHLKAHGDVLLKALQGYRLGTNVFLFRKKVFESIDGFDEKLAVLEDYDLYVRAAASFPLGYVDKVLCHVFEHEDSLGKGSSKQTGYYCRWRLNRKLMRLFPEQIEKVASAWGSLQSDVYRNLAEFALLQKKPRRATVFLCASFAWKRWQPGIVLLWWRIKREY